MAKTEKYLIGPTLLGEIRQVITRVSGTPYRTAGPSLPFRLDGGLQKPSGGEASLKLAKTGAAWPKNTIAAVVVYDSGTPLQEAPSNPANVISGCINKLIDVPAARWVIIGQIAGQWYLINAECF